jgi:hypothetical protein
MLDDLLKSLAERGVEPIGAEGAPRSLHTEHRAVCSFTLPIVEQAGLTRMETPEGVLT